MSSDGHCVSNSWRRCMAGAAAPRQRRGLCHCGIWIVGYGPGVNHREARTTTEARFNRYLVPFMKGRKRLSTGMRCLRGTVRTDPLPADERESRVNNQASTAPPSTDGARLPAEPPPERRRPRRARRMAMPGADVVGGAPGRSGRPRAVDCRCLEWSCYIRANRVSRRGDLTVRRGSGGRGVAPSIAVAHRACSYSACCLRLLFLLRRVVEIFQWARTMQWVKA